MTLKMSPKMTKMTPETLPKQQHIPRHDFYMIFLKSRPWFSWKSASFSILSTNFTYPGFSRSVAASPEKHQKSAQKCTPKHTKIQQNPPSKKRRILSSMLAWFWLQKWPQNDPQILQNGTLGLPRGPLGPLGGAMGPTRCSKTDFWLQFGTPNDPKTNPTSSKMAPLGSQEAPWGAMGPIRCLKIVFSFILAPQITLKSPKWTPNVAKITRLRKRDAPPPPKKN